MRWWYQQAYAKSYPTIHKIKLFKKKFNEVRYLDYQIPCQIIITTHQVLLHIFYFLLVKIIVP